ncbi:MAG: tRNA lysidine(34) synthetase TilS [Gorillibacterium sp.]|nr:tRNA lysidine(34) synthetase TilS [Gorillibacterium sp.]
MNLLRTVENMVREEQLFTKEDRIVFAVSGVPDSIALLSIIHLLSMDWRFKLTVAHVNHGFRKVESAREAAAVAELALKLGIPCETAVFDLPAYIKETGMNSQDAARKKRYEFLVATAEKTGAAKIALAHHAGDQAETVLMRIVRGTGPAGLSGIPAKRQFGHMELIRPFIRIDKEVLINHCLENNLTFHCDSSNKKRIYTRNRVRLDVLPALREFNPRLDESLNRLSELMQAENAYLKEETDSLFSCIVTNIDGGFAFSRAAFAGAHLALQRRLIKLILDYLSAGIRGTDETGYVQTETIRSMILKVSPPNIQFDVGEGVEFLREYDRIKLHAPVKMPQDFFHYISLQDAEGSLLLEASGMKISWSTSDCLEALQSGGEISRNTVFFDLESLHFPLLVRSRREGDRISLFGLNGGKKVKDIFIDAKIPSGLRKIWPIIADSENTILWLPGLRRSAHSVMTEKTTRLFCMTFSGR